MVMGDHCGAAGVGGDHLHLPAHQQVHHQRRYVCVCSTTLEVFRGQTLHFFLLHTNFSPSVQLKNYTLALHSYT